MQRCTARLLLIECKITLVVRRAANRDYAKLNDDGSLVHIFVYTHTHNLSHIRTWSHTYIHSHTHSHTYFRIAQPSCTTFDARNMTKLRFFLSLLVFLCRKDEVTSAANSRFEWAKSKNYFISYIHYGRLTSQKNNAGKINF